MRRLLFYAFLLLGCGEAVGPMRAIDDLPPAPLLADERPLAPATLPGDPVTAWPTPLVYAAGRYLVPWRDAAGLHARLVDRSGVNDLFLGDGTFVGAAAAVDGFVVVTGVAGGVDVHRITGGADRVRHIDIADTLVPGVASDGTELLLVTTRPQFGAGATGANLALGILVADRARAVDLGFLGGTPALWGDGDGFIVGGNLLVSSAGLRDHAPAPQLDGARVFHKRGERGDDVTLDGGSWLSLGAPATWAARDDGGVTIGLLDADGGGERVLHVGADLTPAGEALVVPRSPSVPAWLKSIRGDRALWEGVVQSDHAFAFLDRASLASRGTFVRVPAPSTRTVAAALGDQDALLAWIAADGTFTYAFYAP